MAGYKALQARLANWSGTIGEFSETLDREHVPYLSFSKVGCVEFCGYLIVDHKTGKRFNEADELQFVLDREHVRRQYKATRCLTMVDQYRWVPNLDRIRKPAFLRTQVRLARTAWPQATK